jgi:3-methyladenine DNA glycosylase AlkD
MTIAEALAELEALGNEKTRKQNIKAGAGDNQYGVKRGDLRKLAKKIKKDHSLAMSLWETENIDARFLATLVMEPVALAKTLSGRGLVDFLCGQASRRQGGIAPRMDGIQ